ncbi:hypothetical protein M422DRAFT_266944 [Sphaerobolus stellatus SS14]|uniref:Unplaced genomic scaffold SPHSTscaffold_168, whole genome shotgun sequence n=1 Tax=Sphaerobolus stellatus (strain SS14) TaxID=990650 RepID=A0A0C9V1T6_SPHS4|nr:hypothetical protein M422DRAFT_266944 [Sphaerobolus stellatus SS14]
MIPVSLSTNERRNAFVCSRYSFDTRRLTTLDPRIVFMQGLIVIDAEQKDEEEVDEMVIDDEMVVMMKAGWDGVVRSYRRDLGKRRRCRALDVSLGRVEISLMRGTCDVVRLRVSYEREFVTMCRELEELRTTAFADLIVDWSVRQAAVFVAFVPPSLITLHAVPPIPPS